MNQPDEEQTQPRHPWANDEGNISAKIAAPQVLAAMLELGVSAKAASACAYTVSADLEERGDY